MKRNLIVIAILFLCVRGLTVYNYNIKHRTYYYYGMVNSQFMIADAAYKGHWFSYELGKNVMGKANEIEKFIPIEEYKNFEGSGSYVTFPAIDLPGYGYLIAFTSKYFGKELTSKYAHAIQILMELASLLLFIYCVGLHLGERTSFISGLLYVFCYPFIWPIASQPMRDIFLMPIFAFYIAAFFLFSRAVNIRAYIPVVLLVLAASFLLWFRPSGYYFFFLMSPLCLFVKNKSLISRFALFLMTLLIPFLAFGMPFKSFNLRHYGVENTRVIGRGMWEGMGIIKDNPYGFVLDDSALVPWCKEQGYDVEYSSPEMNKILADYVVKIIKEDPGYYLKTVLVRMKFIATSQLTFILPFKIVKEGQDDIKLKDYVKHPKNLIKHPKGFILRIIRLFLAHIYGSAFFYTAVILAFLMLFRLKGKRIGLIVLLSPVIFSLASQIPIHFEPRNFAVGAWPLVFPLAWLVDRIIKNREMSPNKTES
ncbi:MAG: hypothetical protein ABIH66_14510 [bacterium]